MAAQVLIQLGLVQRIVDPPRAYRNLRRALEIRESIRDDVLDADLRMRFGGAAEDLYVELVHLLDAAAFFPDPDWPEHPEVEMFQLVERARSRSMLELLGDAVAPLLDEERRLAAPDDRAARGELEDVWRRIAETGPAGAEYVQLRRGDPASFADIHRMLLHD
jgi:hypothetical protein